MDAVPVRKVDDDDLLGKLRIERGQREDHRSPARWWWIAGTLAVLAAAIALAWWLWPGRSIEVRTATAVASGADIGPAAVLQATGYVTARRQATVSAQITGTLTEVLIEEGERVEQGQILARLEDSAYRAELAAAEAQAAAARARVAQSEAQLAQAERDLERQLDLVERGLVSRQVAEQARTEVTALEAHINAQRREAAAAEAQVDVARVRYDFTVVRAPFAGVIVAKAAQVGEIISPLSAGGGFTRTGVGTIVDMDSLEIEVDVNESYINRVEPDMPVQAVLDAYPDWAIPGHVIAIIPTADRSKATVQVRIAIDEPDPRIVPDMGVRVSFLESRQERQADDAPAGALVPASAVVERNGRSVVFVVVDETARRREVEPAAGSYGDLRLLTDGVAAGDTVIDEPPSGLEDGAAVRLN